MISVAITFLAILIDKLFGEPKRFHPLVGFGAIASTLERSLNTQTACPPLIQRTLGLVALMICVSVPVISVSVTAHFLAALSDFWAYAFTVIVLYSCIGFKSLVEHAQAIAKPLRSGQLDKARHAVSMIVSRDTENMDTQSITNATIESVLENGADALFSALFWYWLIGIEGAVAYRLINTLDAMWGYKTGRFLHFGYAAAKLDDIMNYIPARLTALSYAFCGKTQTAITCWKNQAGACESPNGGPVMTAGAGALGITLDGIVQYHGLRIAKPPMGSGPPPSAADIVRACRLVTKALLLWLTLLFFVLLLIKG